MNPNRINVASKSDKKVNKENEADRIEQIFPTQFGCATFASGLNPHEAIFIKDVGISIIYIYFIIFKKTRTNGLVLQNSLHLCYLISPIFYNTIEPNWDLFRDV